MRFRSSNFTWAIFQPYWKKWNPKIQLQPQGSLSRGQIPYLNGDLILMQLLKNYLEFQKYFLMANSPYPDLQNAPLTTVE